MLDIKRVLAAVPKGAVKETPRKLTTVWGDEVADKAAKALAEGDAFAAVKTYTPRDEYPHPQFKRSASSWQSLNGWWLCGFVPLAYNPKEDATEMCAEACPPPKEQVATPILVPFSPEADLSGVNRQLQPNEALWYQRTFVAPELDADSHQRCLLHFEGVDDSCAVWVNDVLVGTHQGAYTPFTFDITDVLAQSKGQHAQATLTLCVVDPSDAGVQLRGKQSLTPGNIWYTAQSGIWQPVWLEVVSETRIQNMRITPDVSTKTVLVEAKVTGAGTLIANASLAGGEAVSAGATVEEGTAHATLTFEEIALWSPDSPQLYDLELSFYPAVGATPDIVRSYFAFRSCEVKAAPANDKADKQTKDNRAVTYFFLNDEACFCKGVLNQGYWPDGLMTAPSVEALKEDILAMKAAGYNMLRTHIKVETEWFYYLCDTLGMLVWQDMPTGGEVPNPMQTMYLPTLFSRSWSHYSDTTPAHQAKLGSNNQRYRGLWRACAEATIRRLYNHPSVVTWVLFNEGWGQFNSLAADARMRLVDPTRPIHAVSGWYDQGAGDFFGVHNYFRPQQVFSDPFAHKRDKEGNLRTPRACVTCEFGGLVHNVAGHAQLSRSFGYDTHETLESWQAAYTKLIAQMDDLEAEGLAGYVYTQVSDIEEETNGILTYDRRVNKLENLTS